MKEIKVIIKAKEHANLDSFPFRYGYLFENDSSLLINVDRKENSKDKDKFIVVGSFKLPNNKEKVHLGKFAIMKNSNKVATVIRPNHDEGSEFTLSKNLRKLREDKFIDSQILIKMYEIGVKTHDEVIKFLSTQLNDGEIKQLSSRVVTQTNKVDDLKRENRKLKRENKSLELKIKDLESYNTEVQNANNQGSHPNLSDELILDEVLEDVMIGPSSCTQLVMTNGKVFNMKTSTFDPNRVITEKAKTLVGKKVTISCWDPINEPGKWSNQGYFRNIYEIE